jgi:hypothetical protein
VVPYIMVALSLFYALQIGVDGYSFPHLPTSGGY